MITFYKLLDVDCKENIYVNPKHIERYTCYEYFVEIRFTSGVINNVSKSDFHNMLILEGIDEY